ncbi:FAD/NAD(P)-binding domain-containing protein [Mycena rosella]|uniref:FAD/NAD(P)-binding domain-containing protein n=1 Tax=Mycena rosella TaxID=1033263 RepID=A0AAD7GMK9_MYCRO|nr:FAD/NAD(P)-binding domain-containing protein [Mycena rosella]
MLTRSVLLSLLVGPVLSNAATQHSFQAQSSDEHGGYKFKWPINKVAIIGAGVSGLIAYREFSAAGFADVRVFERDDVPGGNWHYTEETPVDAPIPNADPSVGDFVPSLPPPGTSLPVEKYYSDGEAKWREHRGPKPVWESLESNAPAPIQQITEIPWPSGTPWHLPHRTLARYLRAFASFHGVNSNDANPNIAYKTRVELVQKRYDEAGREHGWTLTLKRLERAGPRSSKATWWTEDFDAVVVATGRYNAPNIPRISGLEDWAHKFPHAIIHSRQYRRPQPFANETVLVVGGATSAVEISREINLHAQKIHLSVRPPNPKLPYEAGRLWLRRLPANVSLVPEIRRFHASNASIELINGTFLSGVTRVIFATGFRYSFPFIPQFHNSSSSTAHPIVTDGTHLRSLHQDFLYIEEPTIGFLSMNWGMQSFTYAEYLSLSLAKVWSGRAVLPGTAELWRTYEARVEDRGGYGRHLQFLGAERTAANIRLFVGWLNDAAVKFGGRQIDGQSKDLPQISAVWVQAQYGVSSPQEDTVNSLDWVHGEDW